MARFTLGADIEVFAAQGGEPVYARVKGTKQQPERAGKFGIHQEGGSVEVQIPVCNSAQGLASATAKGLRLVVNRTGLPIWCGHQVDFEAPDPGEVVAFNAYTGRRTLEQMSASQFAGGHIHIGVKRSGLTAAVMALFCDKYIGLLLVEHDKQPKRRGLFGAAGTYRHKPYGVEYRTPSNFWAINDDARIVATSGAERVARLLANEPMESLLREYRGTRWADVRHAIDAEDEGMAEQLMRCD